MENAMKPDTVAKEPTFIACTDLFATLSERCQEMAADLEHFSERVPETYAATLQRIAEKEQQLAKVLDRAAKEGFSTKLDTRLQFSVSRDVYPKPESAMEALQQTSNINGDVARELQENASKLASEDVAETLGALAQEADSINQQISMARVTMNDI